MFSELHARTNNNDRVLGDVLDQVSEMTMKEEYDTSSFTGNTRTTSTSTCTRTPSSTDATCRSSVTLDTAAILPSSPYKTPVSNRISCSQSLMMALEESGVTKSNSTTKALGSVIEF